MNIRTDPKTMIERPDGSQIAYEKLKPRDQLAHDLVTFFVAEADKVNSKLLRLKRAVLDDLIAHRSMMLEDYGVKIGGDGGNLTLRSACGRMMVKMTVTRHITFVSELESAKALIDEFMEAELAKGGSAAIREIVEKVFKLNAKGRLDTHGILGLREHRFDNPLWEKAMLALEDAICRDSSTTYVNFYHIDPDDPDKGRGEARIPLDMAKV